MFQTSPSMHPKNTKAGKLCPLSGFADPIPLRDRLRRGEIQPLTFLPGVEIELGERIVPER